MGLTNRIIIILLLVTLSLKADVNDTTYTCIAYMKKSNEEYKQLDIKESITKGGFFRFSVRLNFLRAIVSRDKDTINNITYEDMRFAYRNTLKGYDLYIYDYNKDYLLIEKANKNEPRFSIKLENGDRIYHKCIIYKDTNK